MELAVGRIVKSHGLRGEVVVEVRTDSPEVRFAPGARLIGRPGRGGSGDREVTVTSSRNHSSRLLVRFDGVADRDAADALRGLVLLVDSGSLPPTDDPDEFYDHELVGLRAIGTDGTDIGAVADVVRTAAGELLCLTVPVDDGGSREILVPFVVAMVPDIDLATGTVTIDPPEGLLELGPG